MWSTVLDGLGTWVRGSLKGKCGVEGIRLACGGLNLCEACVVLGVLDLSCRGRHVNTVQSNLLLFVFNSYGIYLFQTNFNSFSA